MLRYRLHLEPDDNDTVVVTSPNLPIVTYGADRAEALRNAAEAIDVVIESMMSAREDIPVPVFDDEVGVSFRAVSLQTELKVRLHQAMMAAGLTRADIVRRLGWNRESVDRLFRLDHNSRIEQIDQAFAALGRIVSIEVRAAAEDKPGLSF
jgi:antitoxin HicB